MSSPLRFSGRASRMRDSSVSMVSVPPSGMASRALTARLMITCSSWPWSTLSPAPRSRPCVILSSMVSPISRRSRFDSSASTSVMSSTRGCRVCWREKASSWRTRPAARLAFCLMCMMSAKDWSPGRWRSSKQVREADHGGQQVVEVVGDAAGELADRLHFLGLGELGLEAFQFRGVDEVDDDVAPGFRGLRAALRGRGCGHWGLRLRGVRHALGFRHGLGRQAGQMERADPAGAAGHAKLGGGVPVPPRGAPCRRTWSPFVDQVAQLEACGGGRA